MPFDWAFATTENETIVIAETKNLIILLFITYVALSC